MEDTTSTVKRTTVMCAVCTEFKAKLNCEQCERPICLNCRKRWYNPRSWRKYDIICEPCKETGVNAYNAWLAGDHAHCCSII